MHDVRGVNHLVGSGKIEPDLEDGATKTSSQKDLEDGATKTQSQKGQTFVRSAFLKDGVRSEDGSQRHEEQGELFVRAVILRIDIDS